MTHASPASRRRLAPIAILAALAICIRSHGFIPIKTGSGLAIAWPGGTLEYVVNSQGSDDVADGSEQLAVRLAFQTWGAALVGGLTISENTTADPTSTNTADLSTHRVLFDENDASGYFPSVTGIVALTPVWFTAGGAILDADVIFNGRDHTFSTNLAPSTFDVRDVATHEIGHFLGLDHSAIGGATMFPYVAAKQTDHRSLSDDDVAGMRNAYAGAGPPTGSLSGVAFHLAAGGGAGAPIRGGTVSARRGDGTVAAAALTKQDGSFSVR
ncbi:MAG TPA: matrixin family metalloprotease, partial [Planctomycetota bacterium]|nr:matrixin family metalloprotease [Planctomycetota bacterium]